MNSLESKHLYHRDYFTKQVDGHAEFEVFKGDFDQLHHRYQRNLELLELRPEHRFLEVGCGRGEVVIFHSLRGGEAIGLDYSEDAIGLAKAKASALGVTCDFRAASFSEMPTGLGFDRILASEFIEHISAAEASMFWELAHRALKPSGLLLVYTYPNTLQRRVGYPIQRILVFLLTGRKLPRLQPDMENEHYQRYHLNEQTLHRMKSCATRAGFSKIRVFYDMPATRPRTLAGRLFQGVAHRGPWRHCFLRNLVCLVQR
jgi:cyclopropane fatty-acyl-phospholipid synthase-like methyltransferase